MVVIVVGVCLCVSIDSWLYKEATVQEVNVEADEGSAVVKVIISAAAHGRYKKLYPQLATQHQDG